MDIHRCRFVPYPPSAINAVAFSTSTTSRSQAATPARLAIGRANGDIEIWNPLAGLWHQETVLHGGKNRSIDGLVWVTGPDQLLQDGTRLAGRLRLFSIGYTSTVTEWDLEKGQPKKQASGMHGDIWCLGAPTFTGTSKDDIPKNAAQFENKLVAGTIDGSLVLYTIENDDLQFDRILMRSSSKKTKMVSLAFQSHEKRPVVVVGCSDNAIRVYDLRNGSILSKMTLGSDQSSAGKEIIVWSVKCLKGGDIVSGDSTGQVCIFDGRTYTQAQRLQTHKQDVLSLAVSADGSTILSGGMDRRTVLYRKTTGSGSRWSKIWHRRYHTHDVKTMASFEGPGMSVVISGGPDASPVVMPLREAGMEDHRNLSYLPQNPPLASARKGRLLVSWWEREVHIWRLRRSLQDMANIPDVDGVARNRKLLARILIKGEANITSAAITEDGSLLVVSTTTSIKAFHLKSQDDSVRDNLKVSTVKVHENISSQGANRVRISPDSQWLCLSRSGIAIFVLRISREAGLSNKPTIHPKAIRLQRISRNPPKHTATTGLGNYSRTISHMAFSPDSKVFAAADLAGYIDTWLLIRAQPKLQNGVRDENGDASSDEDSSQSEDDDGGDDFADDLRWTQNPKGPLIPQLQSAPTVLSFSSHIPTAQPYPHDKETPNDYILLTITATPQILTINPLLGALTPWSRRNPISKFPPEFRDTRDLVKGALWSGDRVWLYGNNFLFMFDLSQDLAGQMSPSVNGNELVKPGMKRKRGADTGAGSKMKQREAAGPTTVTRHVPGEGVEDLPLDGPLSDPMDTDHSHPGEERSDSEDSEDEDSRGDGELALLRGAQTETTAGPQHQAQQGQRLAFWQTYKYRPILGIVPLGDDGDDDGNDLVNEHTQALNGQPSADQAVVINGTARGSAGSALHKPLEVAIVERPIWEVDMPDRYYGEGEFDR